MVGVPFHTIPCGRFLSRLSGRRGAVGCGWTLRTGVYTSKSPIKPPGFENEDSCCVGANYICVADGVGGWMSQGISSAFFSRELVGNVERAIREVQSRRPYLNREKFLDLVNKSYETTRFSNIVGSSTLSVVYLEERRLHVFNLGDSKCLVYRKSDGEVVFESQTQQHSFNTPFQLGTGSVDTPYCADYTMLDGLQVGDTIIVATDGLWDNLAVNQILSTLNDDSGVEPQRIADKLGRDALEISLSSGLTSPYSMSLRNYLKSFPGGEDYPRMIRAVSGGKPDDITVSVGVIQS